MTGRILICGTAAYCKKHDTHIVWFCKECNDEWKEKKEKNEQEA